MPPVVRVFSTLEGVSHAVAENLAELARNVVNERGRFSIALAGGNTPRALYECLGTAFPAAVPWEHVHLFWGDERYVPHDDSQSNYRMVRESLLDRVRIPASNVHPMPTHFEQPEDAALAYESTLREFFGMDMPAFDLILLGMGADGHTASLFPDNSTLSENLRAVVPVRAPVNPPVRLSLTMPAILSGKSIYLLIAGKDKAATLKSVLEDPAAAVRYPVRRIFDGAGSKMICWADAAAASQQIEG